MLRSRIASVRERSLFNVRALLPLVRESEVKWREQLPLVRESERVLAQTKRDWKVCGATLKQPGIPD